MPVKEFFRRVTRDRESLIIASIRALLVLAIAGSIYELNWLAVFVSALALGLSIVPELIRKRYQITLPRSIQVFIIVFIFAALFLGEMQSFYEKFWWWNSLLHLLSGIALGFSGFLIVYILHKTGRFSASPFLLSIFAFCFAVAIGTLWEIFEFTMDSILGLDMQKSRNLCATLTNCDTRLGVVDTMRDLILDALGAFSAVVVGYLYLNNRPITFFKHLVHEFELKNHHLFHTTKQD
jgi:uncharacterized membrane protein YjdF